MYCCTAERRAASPPCESIIVVMHDELFGSGGRRTLVMIPGTVSEKCLETKVEIREDFPTCSDFVQIAMIEHKRDKQED
jgi:hypothetical protein